MSPVLSEHLKWERLHKQPQSAHTTTAPEYRRESSSERERERGREREREGGREGGRERE